jgi:hypothetical protein
MSRSASAMAVERVCLGTAIRKSKRWCAECTVRTVERAKSFKVYVLPRSVDDAPPAGELRA